MHTVFVHEQKGGERAGICESENWETEGPQRRRRKKKMPSM
jgi:hypothetical protein